MDLAAVKLIIASPMKPAHVAAAHESSKLQTQRLLIERGIKLRSIGIPDCAWIGHARAAIAAKVMAAYRAGLATHLLMIDNDVSWHPEDVVKLLEHDVPFVGAVQADRKRGTFLLGRRSGTDIRRVVHKYDSKTGLLQAERISAAFQLIKPEVFERMMEAYPELQARKAADWYLKSDEAAKPFFYGLWAQHCENGDWPGEDHAFCDRMVDAGIPLLVDPWVKLGHWVEIERYGCLGDTMTMPDGRKLTEVLAAERGEAA